MSSATLGLSNPSNYNRTGALTGVEDAVEAISNTLLGTMLKPIFGPSVVVDNPVATAVSDIGGGPVAISISIFVALRDVVLNFAKGLIAQGGVPSIIGKAIESMTLVVSAFLTDTP